jgi:glycosyltransferase involved in cell wall biosynthesis
MHIVHLTASSFFGGPERQMLGLASALPSDYATTFLSFAEGGRCKAFLERARQTGFDSVELQNDTPYLGSALREVTEVLRQRAADVLITHGYKSNLLGRPAARRVGIPIVSVSRGWTGENLKMRCYEAIDRFHLRFMDRVVCVSAAQSERVLRCSVAPHRVRVIRNAARLDAFRQADPRARTRLRELAGADGPIVLAAGRLSPEKGFHVLVEAAPDVCNSIPGVKFVILGEGPERQRLERRVAELGIVDSLRLPGFRSDVDTLIPWADVVVLPSLTEGLPNVALEAGAAGVPVVATAVGGTPEVVVDGQSGYLVPPNDAAILADRVVAILANSRLAESFGAKARQRMNDHFSFETQAQEYQALFAELGVAKDREVTCA